MIRFEHFVCYQMHKKLKLKETKRIGVFVENFLFISFFCWFFFCCFFCWCSANKITGETWWMIFDLWISIWIAIYARIYAKRKTNKKVPIFGHHPLKTLLEIGKTGNFLEWLSFFGNHRYFSSISLKWVNQQKWCKKCEIF